MFLRPNAFVLQLPSQLAVVLANKNVVDHVREGLLGGDTLLGTVLGDGVVVLPVLSGFPSLNL